MTRRRKECLLDLPLNQEAREENTAGGGDRWNRKNRCMLQKRAIVASLRPDLRRYPPLQRGRTHANT